MIEPKRNFLGKKMAFTEMKKGQPLVTPIHNQRFTQWSATTKVAIQLKAPR